MKPVRPSRRACVTGLLWALVSFAAPGCQDYPFQTVPRRRISVTHVRELVSRGSDTDILFVIDNSGSMKEEQDNLRRNTRIFIDELAKSDNAYRVGVVSTDLFDSQAGGRLVMRRASSSDLSAASCNIRPDTSGLRYLVRPDPDSPTVDEERCRMIEDFSKTVGSLSTDGAGREAGLEAARRALDRRSFPEVGEYNDGFLREEADLALIFLTDEDDCSFASYGDVSAGSNSSCYELADQATDTAGFVDLFASLKPDGGARKVRAGLIGGGVPLGEGGRDFAPAGCRLDRGTLELSADCGCWSSSPDDFFCTLLPASRNLSCADVDECSTRLCQALPARRYSQFMRELSDARVAEGFSGGTVEDSICQQEYDETLLSMARNVVLSSCFTSEEAAVAPDKVQLTLLRPDDATGDVYEWVVPRLDAADPTADCQSCGQCPDGAWHYVDAHTFCLTCELSKNTGDEFRLTVMHETIDESVEEEEQTSP